MKGAGSTVVIFRCSIWWYLGGTFESSIVGGDEACLGCKTSRYPIVILSTRKEWKKNGNHDSNKNRRKYTEAIITIMIITISNNDNTNTRTQGLDVLSSRIWKIVPDRMLSPWAGASGSHPNKQTVFIYFNVYKLNTHIHSKIVQKFVDWFKHIIYKCNYIYIYHV